MKLTHTLLITAQLATVAVCDWMSEPWAETWNLTLLHGADALAYHFDYNPSMPHRVDFPYRTGFSPDNPIPTTNPRYDTNYISRLCKPRRYNRQARQFAPDYDLCDGRKKDECKEYSTTFEYSLKMWRKLFASSPYPCERKEWIEQECGINVGGFRGYDNTTHKGTFTEQNQCLCNGDYFAVLQACNDCTMLHVGNETVKESEEKYLSIFSSSMCGEAQTATKSMWDYQSSAWESVYTGYTWSEGYNTTIVSDGAQNKTDVSLYMTESVDFVPATIQEPAFTRTIGGKEAVMTPGALKANAKAKAAPSGAQAPATATGTGAAASATASEGGAVHFRASGGLIAAVFVALLML